MQDYASMLKDCSEFNFVPLTPKEADAMPLPPKIYDEEKSGLRKNVAASFDTPLGAFRKSGFTADMISRWTINSNQ